MTLRRVNQMKELIRQHRTLVAEVPILPADQYELSAEILCRILRPMRTILHLTIAAALPRPIDVIRRRVL